MPGTIAEELMRILSKQKAQGTKTAWLSEKNAHAFFFSVPGNYIPPKQPISPPQDAVAPRSSAKIGGEFSEAGDQTRPESQRPDPPKAVAASSAKLPAVPSSSPLPSPSTPCSAAASAVGKMTWDELQDAVQSCQACPLYAGRRHVVLEDGFRKARVMFIGEGPGEDEDAQGVPFVGRAGQLLTKMILAMGLDRTCQDPQRGCYIANIVKCRPPANRNPEPEEGQACLPFLKRQIELVSPEVIVLLGAVPLNFLMQRRGITALRGQWLQYGDIPVMPTFHPAYLLRFERTKEKFIEEKRKVWSDLQQVMARVGLQRPTPSSN